MKKLLLVALGLVLFAVIAALIIAPIYIEKYAESQLNKSERLVWEIEDVDLSVFPVGLKVQNIQANLRPEHAGESTHPEVVQIKDLWLGLAFHALLAGEIELNFEMNKPRVYIRQRLIEAVKKEDKPEEKKKETPEEKILSWRQELLQLVPFRIARIDVKDADIFLMMDVGKKWFSYSITNLNLNAENLTNRNSLKESLYASCEVQGVLEGGSSFYLNLKLDPIARPPALDLNFQAENIELKFFNPLLQEFAKFDLEDGKLSIFTEVKLEDFRFEGYLKTLAKEIDVLGEGDKNDSGLRVLWEALVAGGAEILENQPRDQVALKAPFEGQIRNTELDVWGSVSSLLRNAFIRALLPGIEQEIELSVADI